MKKLIISTLILTLAGCSIPAFAVIDSDRLLSEDYLRNSGYSPETIRLINLKRIDPYAPYKEKEVQTTPVSWVKRFWQYIDPAVDNERFGEGIISPSVDTPSKL